MLEREFSPQEGSRPATRTRGNRAGSVFAVLAGAAMVCTGATAAALAGSHAVAVASTSSQCQLLPTAPSSTPTSTGSSGSTPTISSTPNAGATTLCVAVSAQASSVKSGQDAYYSITVNAKGDTADNVTVQISASSSASSPGAGTPQFTVCGSGDGGQTCTLGTMSVGQSTQLQGKIAIPASAPTGETFTLSAKVTGEAPNATTTGSVTGSASASAQAPKPSPTPTNTHTSSPPGNHHHSGSGHHHSGGGSNSGSGNGTGSNGSAGTTGNTNPLAGLPPLSTAGGSNPLLGTSSGDPGGLFPTINPSSGATVPPASSTGSKPQQRPYKASTVADVLPLNQGQVSAQVAGLIVLGIGIILVFARISLRRPKGSESK